MKFTHGTLKYFDMFDGWLCCKCDKLPGSLPQDQRCFRSYNPSLWLVILPQTKPLIGWWWHGVCLFSGLELRHTGDGDYPLGMLLTLQIIEFRLHLVWADNATNVIILQNYTMMLFRYYNLFRTGHQFYWFPLALRYIE